MSVVDGTGTRDSRGLEISSVCGKVQSGSQRQSSAIGPDGRCAMAVGAICMTEPEGHGAMVDIGPDVKMK